MVESTNPLERLSPREREVLFLLLENKRLKEIAYELQVGIGSVDIYRKRILKKWQLQSRAELIYFCSDHNIRPHKKQVA